MLFPQFKKQFPVLNPASVKINVLSLIQEAAPCVEPDFGKDKCSFFNSRSSSLC